MNMKMNFKVALPVLAGVIVCSLAASPLFFSCSDEDDDDDVIQKCEFLGDDIVAVKESGGKVSIKNTETGKVTIRDIKIEWTSNSTYDSLAIFCADRKRGYYNSYTGEIVIPAQYRRAWVFSEGLAGVQKNGMIGFIDRRGNTVIPFRYPYHGNSLSDFVFHDGHCAVADTTGKCGVIDRRGEWIIRPEYDDISTYAEYVIVSKAGIRMQLAYDGGVLNSFVLDDIRSLTYTIKERFENRDGEISYVEHDVDTGLFSYRIGGRCGLMDSRCRRLTEPLYGSIRAVNADIFRATLIDDYSEVILDARGNVMK